VHPGLRAQTAKEFEDCTDNVALETTDDLGLREALAGSTLDVGARSWLASPHKETVYSICFGKSTTSLAYFLQASNLIALMSHPIVQELLGLRRQWFREIRNAGGAFDVWGEWHALDLTRDPKTKKGRHWEGAVAAAVIQSVELEIIAPLFDVALKHGKSDQFRICLFQHDGATL
jgi:hypothetical protein